MNWLPAPYADVSAEERPDLAKKLGKTVGRCMTMPMDAGTKIGLGVTFKRSGIRMALLGDSVDELVERMERYIAEAPHGRRNGVPWKPER